MFLSLTNREDQPAIIKKKRGLVNIIGNVMNTLFGVCDDICVGKTQNVIRRTDESRNRYVMIRLIETQLTVVKATVKI